MEAGRKLAEQARQANLIHSFTTVAAFASMGSEMSMTPMLQALFDSNCRVLVPRLGEGTDIGWSELDSIHDLRDQTNSDGSTNTHRPQEPSNSVCGPEALKNAGLIIVPAFAVDHEGFRLGRGGGWYDRALEYRAVGSRVVAVCWPWEPTDKPVPHEAHDIPVDGVLTPDGCGRLRERTRICPVKKFENLIEARILCLLIITVARTANTISPSSSRSPTTRSPSAPNAARNRSARCIPHRQSNSRDPVSTAPTNPSELNHIIRTSSTLGKQGDMSKPVDNSHPPTTTLDSACATAIRKVIMHAW